VSSVQKGKVALFPVVVTLQDAGVHVSAPNSGNIPTEVKGIVDK